MTTRRRTLTAAALCAAALGAGKRERAGEIHVELPPDPIAGEALEVRVSGVAEPRSLVDAGVAEVGNDCGRRHDRVQEVDERVGGAHGERESMFSLEPGTYQLCAWLLHDDQDPYEQVATPFTVREGRFEIGAYVTQGARDVAVAEAVVQVTEACTRADRRLLRASAAVRSVRRRARQRDAGQAGPAPRAGRARAGRRRCARSAAEVGQASTLVAPRATPGGGP